MSRDLNFLYEIGTLRFIPRTWRQFLNSDFANVAEHTLRVMWIALVLADMENIKDTAKVIKMALVHDITETRTGDVHYVTRLYTKRNEEKAISDILTGLRLEPEMKALWEEYEERNSPEAKIVKDADTLDVDLELREQAVMGAQVGEVFKKQRVEVGLNHLYTESAKQLWQEIQNSNPHEWHTSGVNRYTSGDWQPRS